MIINLTDTQSSQIASALLKARRNLGNASGMVLTLLVAAEQRTYKKVFEASRVAAREHPSRLILVVNTTGKTTKLDAEIHLAEDVPGEVIVLLLSGELREHPDSAVLPLLLPDSPVVMWWPAASPEKPALDALGKLASRRITDASGDSSPLKALQVRAQNHVPGDTDLVWTRLTPWRALLAAALDQYPTRVTGATVAAARQNAPADLMAAWLESRLGVDVVRKNSAGPGITAVTLETPGGPVVVAREDGVTASYAIPGQPRRVVALKRRDVNELLTEELRRMDADDIYEESLRVLLKRASLKPAKDAGASVLDELSEPLEPVPAPPRRRGTSAAARDRAVAATHQRSTKESKPRTRKAPSAKKQGDEPKTPEQGVDSTASEG